MLLTADGDDFNETLALALKVALTVVLALAGILSVPPVVLGVGGRDCVVDAQSEAREDCDTGVDGEAATEIVPSALAAGVTDRTTLAVGGALLVGTAVGVVHAEPPALTVPGGDTLVDGVALRVAAPALAVPATEAVAGELAESESTPVVDTDVLARTVTLPRRLRVRTPLPLAMNETLGSALPLASPALCDAYMLWAADAHSERDTAEVRVPAAALAVRMPESLGCAEELARAGALARDEALSQGMPDDDASVVCVAIAEIVAAGETLPVPPREPLAQHDADIEPVGVAPIDLDEMRVGIIEGETEGDGEDDDVVVGERLPCMERVGGVDGVVERLMRIDEEGVEVGVPEREGRGDALDDDVPLGEPLGRAVPLTEALARGDREPVAAPVRELLAPAEDDGSDERVAEDTSLSVALALTLALCVCAPLSFDVTVSEGTDVCDAEKKGVDETSRTVALSLGLRDVNADAVVQTDAIADGEYETLVLPLDDPTAETKGVVVADLHASADERGDAVDGRDSVAELEIV